MQYTRKVDVFTVLTFLASFVTGALVPATDLRLINHGPSGQNGISLHLLLTDSIKLDGYLVEWRFYPVDSSGGHPCRSYAAIWRSIGDNKVRIVNESETNLNPSFDDMLQVKLVTQPILNGIVRVQKGDVVSLYVDNTRPPGCRHNIVQFTKSDTQPYNTLTYSYQFKINRSDVLHSVEYQSDFSHYRQTLSPSIQAYVEEYMQIEEAPRASHINATQGQIILSWKSSLNISDTSFIGYRVTCSKDKSFNHSFYCSNRIIPKNTIATLENLDITTALYAKIQVVRLISGDIVLDPTLSPASLLFCPEREILAQGQVELLITKVESTKKCLLKYFFTNLAYDDCVMKLRLSYYSHTENDFGEKVIFNFSRPLKVAIKSEAIYSIAVYLTLVDGHEMVYYSSMYTLPYHCENTEPTTTIELIVGIIVGCVLSSVMVILLLIAVRKVSLCKRLQRSCFAKEEVGQVALQDNKVYSPPSPLPTSLLPPLHTNVLYDQPRNTTAEDEHHYEELI